MQCPRCKTNIYGNVSKCPACGFILFQNKDTNPNKGQENIKNGLLNPQDLKNYTENIELYKKKNKEPNIIIPIIFILGIVIILILIALIIYFSKN